MAGIQLQGRVLRGNYVLELIHQSLGLAHDQLQ
jgi:hypothetical protein